MKVNKNGDLIKFAVDKYGISEITEKDTRFKDSFFCRTSVFEDPIDALLYYIKQLSERIEVLEKQSKD